MIFLLLACGDKEPDSGAASVSVPDWCADSVSATYENFGEGFLLTHCQGCHASTAPNRFGAPEAVTFDSTVEVEEWREAIYRVVLTDETMPPAGGITEDEQTLTEIWLECDR